MKAFRIPLMVFNKPVPKTPLFLQKLSSSAATANPRFSDSVFEESGVYQHKLKLQRPTTIPRRENSGPINSASFIGSVSLPPRITNASRFGVHTFLTIKNCLHSQTTFRILLKTWDEIAVVSFKDLKQKDFIYVSGYLCSYTKNNPNGRCTLFHELVVKEWNYVAHHGQELGCVDHEKPQSDGGETGLKFRERLHLWQVLFSNPYDWWDNRKKKLNPRQPDFKHKYMDEALWLRPDDPPWVKTQIHRLDERMAEQGYGKHAGHHARISKWEYDE